MPWVSGRVCWRAMDVLLIAAAIVLCAIGGFLGALIGRWGGSTQLRNFASVVLIAGALAVTSMAVRPWLAERRAEQALRWTPAASAIRELDPETYQKLLAAKQEGNQDKLEAFLAGGYRKYILSSTDEAVREYYSAYRMQLEEFVERDLDECNRRVGWSRTVGDVTGIVSPEAQERVSVAMDAVIRAAAEEWAPREFDESDAEYDLDQIMGVIGKNRSDQAFLEGTTNQPVVETCEALLDLIDHALQINSRRSAGLFRYLVPRLPR